MQLDVRLSRMVGSAVALAASGHSNLASVVELVLPPGTLTMLDDSQQGSCAALGITRRKLRTAEARLMSGLRRALLDKGIMRGDLVVSASRLCTYRRSRNLAHAP